MRSVRPNWFRGRSARGWSIRAKIISLLAVPLVTLVVMWGLATFVTVGPGLDLVRARANLTTVAGPADALRTELQAERTPQRHLPGRDQARPGPAGRAAHPDRRRRGRVPDRGGRRHRRVRRHRGPPQRPPAPAGRADPAAQHRRPGRGGPARRPAAVHRSDPVGRPRLRVRPGEPGPGAGRPGPRPGLAGPGPRAAGPGGRPGQRGPGGRHAERHRARPDHPAHRRPAVPAVQHRAGPGGRAARRVRPTARRRGGRPVGRPGEHGRHQRQGRTAAAGGRDRLGQRLPGRDRPAAVASRRRPPTPWSSAARRPPW